MDPLYKNDGYYYGVSENGATRTVLNMRCLMEEKEPGRYVRNCYKIEKMLTECNGRPTEMVTYGQEIAEVKDCGGPPYKLVLPYEAAQEMLKDFPRIEAPKEDVSKNAAQETLKDFPRIEAPKEDVSKNAAQETLKDFPRNEAPKGDVSKNVALTN